MVSSRNVALEMSLFLLKLLTEISDLTKVLSLSLSITDWALGEHLSKSFFNKFLEQDILVGVFDAHRCNYY